MGITLSISHIPVMIREVIENLAIQVGGRYVDCTLGEGGHTQAILESSSPGGQILGIDDDTDAIKSARDRLSPFAKSVMLVNANFASLRDVCVKYDFLPVHGILLDLGLSSQQLDEAGRGFSFQSNSPLDMRFNPGQKLTAADIVNKYSETKLAEILKTFGEEMNSRQIARRIVQQRPITTTTDLASIVEEAVGGRHGKIHPATRTFQALRIVVNNEMENLASALNQAVGLLGFGGRLVVISYHSLEDRIVKRFMQQESRDCICPPEAMKCTCLHKASLRIITKKIVTPSLAETELNPRSRSAKLRAAERIIVPNEQYRQTIERSSGSTNTLDRGWEKPAIETTDRLPFIGRQNRAVWSGGRGIILS